MKLTAWSQPTETQSKVLKLTDREQWQDGQNEFSLGAGLVVVAAAVAVAGFVHGAVEKILATLGGAHGVLQLQCGA